MNIKKDPHTRMLHDHPHQRTYLRDHVFLEFLAQVFDTGFLFLNLHGLVGDPPLSLKAINPGRGSNTRERERTQEAESAAENERKSTRERAHEANPPKRKPSTYFFSLSMQSAIKDWSVA